ncbi:MAG: hypothetical protein HC936_16075 [Leptolyngbyaceae cyanobacterium SU_3_3]|nr:hypothetical protein [Leptolyngbyaceae cyanobacterium SU_3_3]
MASDLVRTERVALLDRLAHDLGVVGVLGAEPDAVGGGPEAWTPNPG